MITDDADLVARAIIMSGAYEHNWAERLAHGDNALKAAFGRWQNKLPLYNLRLSNLSAALIRPRLDEDPAPRARYRARGARSRGNPARAKPMADRPRPAGPGGACTNSIQFDLTGMSDADARAFAKAAADRGVKVQIFGQSQDNARAFWNWQFIEGPVPELPLTRAMLSRACDTRLPARLTRQQQDAIAAAILGAAEEVMGDDARAYGT